MKRFLFILALVTFNQLVGQNIKILYSLYFDKPEKKYLKFLTPKAVEQLTTKKYFYLQKNDTSSIFYSVTKGKVFNDIDSTVVISKNKQSITKHTYINEVTVDNRVVDDYYINYKKKYYINKKLFFGSLINIKDTLPVLKWQILDSIKQMKGYTIQKAITTYHDIPITAWFTEDIPINAGPLHFQGLPGLIMKLKMNAANYEVEKITFLKKPPKIEIPKPESTYLTSQQYFEISKKNKYKSKIIEKKCVTCPKGL